MEISKGTKANQANPLMWMLGKDPVNNRPLSMDRSMLYFLIVFILN
jgi:hypothetical protein